VPGSPRVGAIGVIALSILAGCSGGRTPSPAETAGPSDSIARPATPTAVPAPTSPVVDVDRLWQAVTPNPLTQIGQPVAATWSGAQFVIAAHPPTAVGSTIAPASFSRNAQTPTAGRYASPGDPRRSFGTIGFWTSVDGQSWSSAGQAGTGEPAAFAFDGGVGIAVGTEAGAGVVWSSPDGRTWTRTPASATLGPSGDELAIHLDAVAHGPAGYVALGRRFLGPGPYGNDRGPLVFWSPDGRSWERDSVASFIGAFPADIVVVADRYVISGPNCDPDCDRGATVWTSTNGRSWSKSSAPGDGRWRYAGLAAVPDAAILAGTEAGGCTTWRSSDGIAWSSVAEPCPPLRTDYGGTPTTIAPGGPEFVAQPITDQCALAFSAPNLYFCAPPLEVSATGDQWTTVLAPSVYGHVLAASPDALLWTGTGPSGAQGGLWITDLGAPQ
jgi:hypothetical protein